MSEKRKIVLVGTGFVGMSMAYSFLNTGGIDELVLIDVDQEKAIGEAMDLQHGLPYARGKMSIKAGGYEECRDAAVVVITAGVTQKPTETRLDLTARDTVIMKSVTEQIMASGFDGILVIASNPVDAMTYVAQKEGQRSAKRACHRLRNDSGHSPPTLYDERISGCFHQQYSRVYHGRAWRFQLCAMDQCLCRLQESAGPAG